ncbi:MAG: ribosome biogenesis GTPase Der [Oscillospiraceae bacterium]|jgi:GTP-binding protein|nr:ribosome biogenesis GTPase Der [Oscillospiraceae bacterium]
MGNLIAVVGRPNVGKSTLFNKLTGTRQAIVDDAPGVTRDRLYGKSDWRGRELTLIDTGGIEPLSKDALLAKMREQARLAIDSADVIVFVADVRGGVTANDKDVAAILQKSGKPVVLCVNKCDNVGDTVPDFYEFYNLGLGEPYAVSSVHGHGTGDLLDAVVDLLPPEDAKPGVFDDLIKIAVIGKPNSGKSSLVNKIAGEERSIVSDMAGTTRDAIDAVIERNGEKFLLIDTAGVRRKSRVSENVEYYSVLRALSAIERADVCVIMTDAEAGFTEQDSKISGFAHERGKASVIAVNKWDIIEKDGKTMDAYRKKSAEVFSFMSYAPSVFISAKTGQRIDKLFELIKLTYEQNLTRIGTGRLNELLARATARVQPPSDRGRRLKLYYMTQAGVKPPTFVVFCNKLGLFHFSYMRYIENQIREAFGLNATPIKIIPRERGD